MRKTAFMLLFILALLTVSCSSDSKKKASENDNDNYLVENDSITDISDSGENYDSDEVADEDIVEDSCTVIVSFLTR